MRHFAPLLIALSFFSCTESIPECADGTCDAGAAEASTATADVPAAPPAAPVDVPASGGPDLLSMFGCDGVESVVREVMARQREALVEQIYRTHYARCVSTEDDFRRRGSSIDFAGLVSRNVGGTIDSSGTRAGTAAAPGTDYSTTNNQVAAVDEADIVKTDGVHLFVASRDVVSILRASPPESTREIARITLAGGVRKLLLHANQLVVFLSVGTPKTGGLRSFGSTCTYGYDCDFMGDGTATHILIYDVANPAEPRLTRELKTRASLLTARLLGSTVHTVVGSADPVRQPPTSVPPPLCTKDPTTQERIIADVKRMARAEVMDSRVPPTTATLSDSATGRELPLCAGANVVDRETATNGFTSLLSFDLSTVAPPQVASVMSRGGVVYASEQSLYLAVRGGPSGPWTGAASPTHERSRIHRFRIGADPASTRYEASGVIEGRALNQFALDEWQGHLRVATTSGTLANSTSSYVHNSLIVLAQHGMELRETGRLTNLARGEDIRSVRFVGPRGYVVTFKKVDPLFVFDLADATAPKVLSELKVEGFSTYMHPLGEGHLLTIGYDASDQGSFAWFTGVLLQLFDVTDPYNPKLAHRTVIGTRGSSSAALTDHLAFNYFMPKGILSVPMTICEGGTPPGFAGAKMAFSGLMVFDVGLTTGIVERGRVANPKAQGGYDDPSCSNWWTQANTPVKRSVVIGDHVYAVADNAVRVQDLRALGTDVATVPIEKRSCYDQNRVVADGQSFTRVVQSVDDRTSVSCSCSCVDGTISCVAPAGAACSP